MYKEIKQRYFSVDKEETGKPVVPAFEDRQYDKQNTQGDQAEQEGRGVFAHIEKGQCREDAIFLHGPSCGVSINIYSSQKNEEAEGQATYANE